MVASIDHTIVPSGDKKQSAEFYAKILGFEDLGEKAGSSLRPVRVNSSTIIFFEDSSDSDSPWAQGIHHLAFHFDRVEFQQVFSRIKAAGIPFGDAYDSPANLKGPGLAPGSGGSGKSVYFKDPFGNLLQVMTY